MAPPRSHQHPARPGAKDRGARPPQDREGNREGDRGADRGGDQGPGVAVRRQAAQLIDTIISQKQGFEEAGDQGRILSGLSPRDRALARAAVLAALRHLGAIDQLIGQFVTKPLPEGTEMTHQLLRLGAAEMLVLGVAPHAAVSSLVAAAAAFPGARPFKGLINAVLRRIDREGRAIWAGFDLASLTLPAWLRDSWTAAYGAQTAHDMAAAALVEPALDLTVKDKAARETLAQLLEASILPTGSLRRTGGGRIEALPGFEDGSWWVQDAAAALPATLLGDVAGKQVIDLCAAPGGKTAQLCSAGAIVTAVDRSAARLARLDENLARLKLKATLVAADGTQWRPAGLADAVLLDAPCSATGTLRRHPDLALQKTPEDVAKLVILQTRLLHAAQRMVKPGGLLVFSTCSLEPAEGPERIAAFLSQHPHFKRVPVKPEEAGGEAQFITPDGDIRTLPSHWADKGGIDGFYAARLIRTE